MTTALRYLDDRPSEGFTLIQALIVTDAIAAAAGAGSVERTVLTRATLLSER